uniref:Uncharacterized protein n=1 Tax=Arundo donax TaxID=35708 RepID=A0A0A9AQ54_ARUDO
MDPSGPSYQGGGACHSSGSSAPREASLHGSAPVTQR